MSKKRITDVSYTKSLNDNDSLFINQGSAIKQINKNDVVMGVSNGGTGAKTAAAARTNLGALGFVDVIDNLESTETNVPLSANQGNVLNKDVEEIKQLLSTSDGTLFRFAVDENGEYGHIVTDSEGADTFYPFSGKYKKAIVDALSNTELGLTYDSTWDEIIIGLNTMFPEQFNILIKWTNDDWVKIVNEGTNSKSVTTSAIKLTIGQSNTGKYGKITIKSKDINITSFNNISVSYTYNHDNGSEWIKLITDNGETKKLTNGKNDISNLTGNAHFEIGLTPASGATWTDGSQMGEGYYPGDIVISTLIFQYVKNQTE